MDEQEIISALKRIVQVLVDGQMQQIAMLRRLTNTSSSQSELLLLAVIADKLGEINNDIKFKVECIVDGVTDG